MRANTLAEQLATLTTGYTPDLEREQQEPTYYDYPVLKAPIWRWEIVWYFFLGGLAAGCYVIASIAALFGSQEDQVVARTGYYLSLLALLPCPPLLIKDLGRPERFLNMLRVFKVKSPMSMGVWGLLTFSMFSGTTAMIQAARDGILGKWWGARWLAKLPQRLLAIPGSFFGIFLGGYTGVLLATTSIPLWSRSKLLGAIFISSAMSTSSALISLALRINGAPRQTLHKLEQMEWLNMLVELIGLLAFLRSSGRAARPLVGTAPTEQGMTFWRFMFGGGLVLPWLIQTILLLVQYPPTDRREREKPMQPPTPPDVGHSNGTMLHMSSGFALGHSPRKTASSQKQKGGVGLIVSALVLVGGYFLRRTVINAGHVSSKDARTTLWNTR